MQKRTFNIIMACKGNFGEIIDCEVKCVSDELSPYEGIIEYMSTECGCIKETYNKTIMDKIMLDAMCDYLDTCDRPSSFIRTLQDIVNKEQYSIGELVAIGFSLVQVKTNEKYINGFGEYLNK